MKLKKIISTSLAVLMLFSAVACNNTEDETDTPGGSDPTTTDNNAGGEDTERRSISIFVPSRVPEAIYDADTMTFKALAEALNLELDIRSVVQSEADTEITTMLSGGDYPDVLATSVGNINEYGVQGAFEPLDSYLTPEAAPNITAYLLQNDTALPQALASDGQLYGVPMQSAIKTAMGYMIRQDWLDDLGLDVPETIDDWYEVLTAFKTNDVNGQGVGSVTPLVLDKAWENYYYNFADAWGIELNPNNDFWLTREDTVEYAPLLDESKEFITTMAQWYAEGLIDTDFVTREDTNNYHVLNDLAGSTLYWTGYIAGMNNDPGVLENDPDTNWQVINPPVLEAGQEALTYSQQSEVVPYSWAMSVNAENKDAIIEMFDYVYGEEGSLLFNFGVEDVSYTMVDGEPQYTDEVLNGEGGSIAYIRRNGMQALLGMRQMPEYEAASTPDEDIRAQLFNYDVNELFYPFNPTIPRNEEEQRTYEEVMSAITTYADEELLKFVLGTRPIAEYDDFVQTIREMGIDEITEIQQGAYNRYAQIG